MGLKKSLKILHANKLRNKMKQSPTMDPH